MKTHNPYAFKVVNDVDDDDYDDYKRRNDIFLEQLRQMIHVHAAPMPIDTPAAVERTSSRLPAGADDDYYDRRRWRRWKKRSQAMCQATHSGHPLCKYFALGCCNKGNDCNFMHVPKT